MRRLVLIACVVLAASLLPARAAAQPQAPIAPSPTGAPATGEMTVEDVLARNKVAGGIDKRSDDEHELWTVRASGLDGEVETWRRGSDFRTDTTLGRFKTARGSSHGIRWHQNENGETILDKPEPSQVEHVVSQTLARVREPIDAWAVTTTFASGHVARNYYDSKSFLLVRTDRAIAGRDSHIVFEDFRTDGRGRTRPWHYVGGDDRPDNEYDYRLQRDDPTAQLTDPELGVPRDRRTLVEFPAGSDTVRLPARIVNDRVFVRLTIAGRGLDFELDSGSSVITIDTPVARELGLDVMGRGTQTVAGSFLTGRIIVPMLGIGPLVMHDVVMHAGPIPTLGAPGVRIVGLLGFDFFDAVGLRIDFENGTVDAYRPGTMGPPAAALPLDIALNTGVPVVHAMVGDAAGDDFILDTGAAFPYVLFQRFLRAHPSAAAAAPGDSAARYLLGVGGKLEYRNVTAKRFAFGAYTFDDAAGVEALSPNAFGFDNRDGLIGIDILKLFTIYTDYGAGKLFLGPTARLQAVGARTATAERR